MGQNFSRIEQVGHRLDRQRVRRQRAGDVWTEDGNFCVEDGGICVCKPIQAKAKPRRPSTTCSSSRTIPLLERTWIDIEPGANSIKLIQWQKEYTLFFDTENYLEKKMARSTFWRSKDDLQNKFEYSQFWSCMYGGAKWQESEATIKDFNTVLTRQDKKFLTFELFNVIRDAIPLIVHGRTMHCFRTISSSTFIIEDVQSIYTPWQIQDW